MKYTEILENAQQILKAKYHIESDIQDYWTSISAYKAFLFLGKVIEDIEREENEE